MNNLKVNPHIQVNFLICFASECFFFVVVVINKGVIPNKSN